VKWRPIGKGVRKKKGGHAAQKIRSAAKSSGKKDKRQLEVKRGGIRKIAGFGRWSGKNWRGKGQNKKKKRKSKVRSQHGMEKLYL